MNDIASRRATLGIVPAKVDADAAFGAATGAAVGALIEQLEGWKDQCQRLQGELAAANARAQASADVCASMQRRAELAESALTAKQAAFDEGRQMVTDALLAQARAEERAAAAEAARIVAVDALQAERGRPLPALLAPPAEPATPPQAVKAWLLETRDAQGNQRRLRMTPEY